MAKTAVNIVIAKLVPLLREEGNLFRGIHDDVTSIKDLLETMTSFLKDADAKAERANMSSGVKTWVKQTREMATHIEDVIDEYLRHIARRHNKRGFTGFIFKTNHFVRGLFARHEMASQIQLIKKCVLQIQQTSEAYGFNSTEQTAFSSSRRDDMLFDPRMASLYTEEAELVGIQTLRDKLIDWSIGGELESRRSVSSLVGMGGLGKTTLAKKVFDNQEKLFSDHVYDLEPLSPDMAWELFCKKTFRVSMGYCPPQLKEFATIIISRCGGLPLAIVAISGLLQTKGEDVSQWRKLLDSLSSELESNPHLTNITKILSFSYYDLPYQLRSCFLYFGTYPENRTIKCSRLIRQWIAEGFIKEQRGKTLEDVAEEYLTELIQRSLVQVSLGDETSGKLREC
ncbi:disease resistance protein RPM1-like [Prunus yedoensis var. nudiflora]|uniref:Disease resistance protein RPM1-like n=1 Tax=Prunus yedoensis var. nudiflora TaxID=2094558 RepID=A0A314UYS7_PRUYE|nr:disease resistance protein RPM1-like [Prunus yedoensis var. nudiflora]